MTRRPDFVVIGAMKCGTSSLHEQLALQPGIFMSELKEPNFFSNDEEYRRGISTYSSHFQAAENNDLVGESSTHYTKLPTYPLTVQRLREYLPDARFIYVMRHPVDRLVSQYIHEWTVRVIDTDINTALTEHRELIDYSLYARQLKPYIDTFGTNKVLPVFFESLFGQPQKEIERICQFLGYTGSPVWQDREIKNASDKRIRSSAWRDAIVNNPVVEILRRSLIPKSLRTRILSIWSMSERPQLHPEQLHRLEGVFDQDLALLGEWLGIELTCKTYMQVITQNPSNWPAPSLHPQHD